ncbi:hypothetical protein [Ideonella sp.]|uniref:hypothetical protein n=1 Tax=Ideonella sp. TaxID=1929293 RepID=UPI0035B285AF
MPAPIDTPSPADTADFPCPNALVVATFALMTRWAALPPDARTSGQAQASLLRPLLARKIVSNLFFLMHHPDVPPPMAAALRHAHAQWQAMDRPAPDEARPALAPDEARPARAPCEARPPGTTLH